MKRNQSKNDLSNIKPLINDIEKKEHNNNELIDNKNNFFNSQKLPVRYIRNNLNNYDYEQKINNKKSYIDDYNNNEFLKEKISDVNLTEYSDENCSLIKSFAYKENPNRAYRDYMEDKSRVIQNINGDKNNHLFCLFDGHGGVNVSQFLQENFYKYFKEIFPITNPEENFK